MKYHFKIHKEGKGFWAECLEFEGCITQGKTLEELHKNMQEALNLYIQEPEDSTDLSPFPDVSIKKSRTVVEVPVDPEVAFAFLMRYYRIKHRMTQKEAAKRMGFGTLFSYQRLEGKKCNPNLKTISKIRQVFPDFSVDLALSC